MCLPGAIFKRSSNSLKKKDLSGKLEVSLNEIVVTPFKIRIRIEL